MTVVFLLAIRRPKPRVNHTQVLNGNQSEQRMARRATKYSAGRHPTRRLPCNTELERSAQSADLPNLLPAATHLVISALRPAMICFSLSENDNGIACQVPWRRVTCSSRIQQNTDVASYVTFHAAFRSSTESDELLLDSFFLVHEGLSTYC